MSGPRFAYNDSVKSLDLFIFSRTLNDLRIPLFSLLSLRAGLEIGGHSLDGSVRALETDLSPNKTSLNLRLLVQRRKLRSS